MAESAVVQTVFLAKYFYCHLFERNSLNPSNSKESGPQNNSLATLKTTDNMQLVEGIFQRKNSISCKMACLT